MSYLVETFMDTCTFSVSASGSGRCEINNGGCWKKSHEGKTYSACVVSDLIVSFACVDLLIRI